MTRPQLVARLLAAGSEPERKKLLAEHSHLADVRLARALKDECYRLWTSSPANARLVASALKTLARADPSVEVKAILHWVAGIANITRGKLETAVDDLNAASKLLSRIGNRHESAQPQVAKLIALAMLGRYDEAQAAGRRALKIFEQFNDQLAAGKIEMNLSNVVSRRDQYRLAESYCLSAYKRFAKLGETTWQTMAENGLANTYAELNEFDKAERFYSRALARARSARMNLTVAEIEASIGNLALFRGRYADALRSLERSRQMYERLAMPHQTAIAELEIADIYAELNLNSEAAELYRILIPKLHGLKMRAEEARARANYGRVRVAIDDPAAAKKELRRAARLYQAEKNPVAASAVELRLASLESAASNNTVALKMIDAAWPSIEASENARLVVAATWLRGDILAKLGDHASAEEELSKALDRARRSDQPAVAQAAMNSLGELSQRTGDTGRAERYFCAAIDSVEAARAPLPGEEFRMAFLAKTLAPYENLARLYVEEGRVEEAFLCVERARSRSLLEAMSRSRRSSAVGSSVSKIREELNAYYSRLDRADPEEAGRLQNEIQKREKLLASTALRKQSTARHRGPAEAHADLDIRRLQQRLGRTRALVEFVISDDSISAFVITHDAVHHVRDMAVASEIMSLLEGLHFQFGALRFGSDAVGAFMPQLKERANSYLAALFDQLLRPVEALIADRDLVIVPAGPLNYVPFAALFDGARYTVASREIIHSPSAAVWLKLNSRRVPGPRNALVMAYADEKIPLVYTEASQLGRTLPNSTKITGRRATFAAFERRAPEFDLIHLACHGQFRPDNPMFSSLHLADGWITVRDICSRRIRAGLVTLSACETGLSRVFAGEEILGLARGFLSAGAKSLILSLWTVNDAATVELMLDFYDSLQRGLSVAASLRVAQQNLIKRGEHPYFWSPFFAIA